MCLLQVEDDKAQITAVIQQLDEKKRIALEETWKHVSLACLHWPVGCFKVWLSGRHSQHAVPQHTRNPLDIKFTSPSSLFYLACRGLV
jgi:hypothetical protein